MKKRERETLEPVLQKKKNNVLKKISQIGVRSKYILIEYLPYFAYIVWTVLDLLTPKIAIIYVLFYF